MANSTLRQRASFNRRRKSSNPMSVLAGPKDRTIQTILSYSRALKVVDAPPIGEVSIILN